MEQLKVMRGLGAREKFQKGGDGFHSSLCALCNFLIQRLEAGVCVCWGSMEECLKLKIEGA